MLGALIISSIHLEVKQGAAKEAYRLDAIDVWKGGQPYGHASISKLLVILEQSCFLARQIVLNRPR